MVTTQYPYQPVIPARRSQAPIVAACAGAVLVLVVLAIAAVTGLRALNQPPDRYTTLPQLNAKVVTQTAVNTLIPGATFNESGCGPLLSFAEADNSCSWSGNSGYVTVHAELWTRHGLFESGTQQARQAVQDARETYDGGQDLADLGQSAFIYKDDLLGLGQDWTVVVADQNLSVTIDYFPTADLAGHKDAVIAFARDIAKQI